jgi:diguanylate cyclase (GGDEF)-like protein
MTLPADDSAAAGGGEHTPQLGFAQRSYRARQAGLLFGLPMVLTVLYERGDLSWSSWLLWLGPLLHALVWPHLAWWRARQSRDPFRVEGGNLLADHFLGGAWTALMAFNAVPSLLILALMSMDSVAGCGARLMLRGLLVHALGVLAGVLFYGFDWQPLSSLFVVAASVPMLVHPVAIGFVTNQALRKLQRQREALETLSRIDALSGLANRGHWEVLVRKEFARYRRYGHTATLVMADLDHFKYINDRYGHAAGDEAIRRFAALLGRELRANDTAGRYGGEEFGILLPDTSGEGAREMMTRLRQCLHADPLIDGHVVTASFGVAELTPMLDTCESWMRVADQMLYRAKHAGRDRIVLPGPGGGEVEGRPATGDEDVPPHLAVAAARPDVLRQLLTGIDMSETAFALFDPVDRLVLANAAFIEMYCVPPGDLRFADLMRHCHTHRIGPRIETDDIEAWLAAADSKRRSQPWRSFDVDMMDGRRMRIEETSFGEGWVLTAIRR